MTVVPQPGEVFFDDEGNKSVVLPDGCDPNYNPPQDELEEYAEFIGINVKTEKDLMWVALEGLRTPLPANWRACQTGDEEVYYFNFDTGESLWDHPMDNTFKEKVIAERAKLKNKGSSSAGTSSKAKKEPETAKQTPVKQQESVTKALTASLLGNSTAKNGLSNNLQGLGNPKSGRLSALGGNTIEGSTSSCRIQPDISDLLQNTPVPTVHAGSSTTFGSTSSLHSSSLPPKGLNTSLPAGASSGIQNSLEMEKNIRRRIETEYETKLKAEVAERERNYNLEKNRLESSLQKSRESLESAWKIEQENMLKTMTTSTNRETNEMNQNWQRRIKEVRDTITKREEEIKLAKAKGDSSNDKGLPLEEYTKQLKEENEKKVREKREELQTRMNTALKQLDEEQNKTLDELSRRAKAFVESTKKRIEQESAQSILLIQSKSQSDLSSVMSELSKLKEELKKQQQESQALAKAKPKQQPSLASLRAGKTNSNENDQVKKAQKEADDMVRQVDHELDGEMEKIEESFEDEQRKLSLELETLQKEIDTLTKNTPALPEPPQSKEKGDESTMIKTTSTPTLSAIDRSKLSEEEAVMRKEVLKRIEAFEKETEELCKTKQLSVAKSSTPSSPLGPSSSGTQSSAIEKAKQNHLQIVKQLEFTHEQTMRKLREAHHRSLASQDRYDVRKSSEFTKMLNEKKKAWLAVNPTPCYNVEDLPDSSDLEEKEREELPPINDKEIDELAEKRLESFKPVRRTTLSTEDATVTAQSVAMKSFEERERENMRKRMIDYEENSWRKVRTEEQKRKDHIQELEAAIANAKSMMVERQSLLELNNRKAAENNVKKTEEHTKRMEVLRSRLKKAEECVEAEKKRIATIPTTSIHSTVNTHRDIVEVEEYSFQNDGSFILHNDAEKEIIELKKKLDALIDHLCADAATQQEHLTKILRSRQRPPMVPLSNESKRQPHHQMMISGGVGRSNSDDGAVVAREESNHTYPHEGGSEGGRGNSKNRKTSGKVNSPPAVSSSEALSPEEELHRIPPVAKRVENGPMTISDAAAAEVYPQAHQDAAVWCHIVRQRIREQKRVLREKQRTMETLREEWRQDMRLAKQQGDKQSIQTLREVRQNMEDQARKLNAAVLAVKMERDQLDEFSRWRFGGRDNGDAASAAENHQTILRLVQQMTDQSKHLEGVLRHESKEEFATLTEAPSKKESRNRKSSSVDFLHHSHHSDRKSKEKVKAKSSVVMEKRNESYKHHSSRTDNGVRSRPSDGVVEVGFENGDEIRWQKVNYIRQVENWLQQQSH